MRQIKPRHEKEFDEDFEKNEDGDETALIDEDEIFKKEMELISGYVLYLPKTKKCQKASNSTVIFRTRDPLKIRASGPGSHLKVPSPSFSTTQEFKLKILLLLLYIFCTFNLLYDFTKI